MSEKKVQEYYDNNTRRFLRLGASTKEMSIHRAVWTKGVRDRSTALETVNLLILNELVEWVDQNEHSNTAHVLDLGCGVGGTLFYLARHFPKTLLASGVTLSPTQCQIARDYAQQVGLADRCLFYTSSYLDLPTVPIADMAVAVESFSLGTDPERFFTSAAGSLRSGGCLIIIDDFLSDRAATTLLHPQQKRWIAEFRDGWHANSLITSKKAEGLARKAGLRLCSERNLTPDLHIMGLRDRIVAATVFVRQLLPLDAVFRSTYWNSLVGGNALQHGLRHGIFEYQLLLFKKTNRA